MTISGGEESPRSTQEWLARADACLDRKSRSYVADALVFARFVRDHVSMVDNLSSVQARSTELLEQRRCLTRLVESLASAEPDDWAARIAQLVTAVRGMQ